jgi:hypothetical protein
LALHYCRRASYQGNLNLQAVDAGDEVHLVLQLPVPMPQEDALALQNGGTGDNSTAVPTNIDSNIRILRGTVALHNGRIHLQPHHNTTNITIALPIFHPPKGSPKDN